MLYGYARVSTTEQNAASQEAALRLAGCDVIRTEKKSGATTEGRTELETLLQFLRPGDVLVCTRIDRLARSVLDLQKIVQRVAAIGAQLRCTEQPVDTTTAAGKAFLDMLGVFAEFETNLRRERQADGIAQAKAAGVYKGKRKSIDRGEVRRLLAEGHGATEVAARVGCSRRAVYNIRDEAVA